MKKSFNRLTVIILSLTLFTGSLFSQSGIFDRDFATDGKLDIEVNDGGAIKVFFYPDESNIENSKIVSLGYYYDEAYETVLCKINMDSSMDESYGNGGISVIEFNYPGALLGWINNGIAMPDGEMICAGLVQIGNKSHTLIANILENGSLDPAFGDGGYTVIDMMENVTNGVSWEEHVLHMNDGKFMIIAKTNNPNDTMGVYTDRIGLPMFNENGTVDNTFGEDGQLILNELLQYGIYEFYIKGAILLPDGSILISGEDYVNFPTINTFVVKLNNEFEFDSSFADNGVLSSQLQTMTKIGEMEITPNGKLLLAGSIGPNSQDLDVTLACYHLDDGTINELFGNNGFITHNTGSMSDDLMDVCFMDDGSIIGVGGFQKKESKVAHLIMRFNSDGTLYESFGTGGKYTYYSSMGFDFNYLESVTVQTDGKIIMTGTSRPYLIGLSAIHVARLDNLLTSVPTLHFQTGTTLIYPNPVNAKLNIISNGDLLFEKIEIIDISGQKVYSGNSVGQQDEIDVSKLSNGVYFLKLYTDNKIETQKFIKQ